MNLPTISVLFSSEVYEAGGHEILIQQLNGSCPRTVANVAATLGNMAEQEVIRCSILSHGAIQALVEPLKSTNTQVQANTTLFLAALACDAEARAEVGFVCLMTVVIYQQERFLAIFKASIIYCTDTKSLKKTSPSST